MAIATTISRLFIRKKDYNVDPDFCYLITPTNFNVSLAMLNFGSDNDEAIDGSLRSNLRGFRMNLDIPHEKLLTSTFKRTTKQTTGVGSSTIDFSGLLSDFSNSDVTTFFTDIISAFKTDSDDYVEVSFDGIFENPASTTLKDFRKIVIDTSSFKTVFTNQTGRDSSTIKFVGQKKLIAIPNELQAT
tara:strand:- start:711 stop:1271 length:561 start_codon:yes stop_codon:yes gene_type:complete